MKHTQKGAILITSLLLLLVLTIIGVSVMQMTRMQERMAGNTRDINLAFQGAEAALRTGEIEVQSFPEAPAYCTTAGASCSAYDRDILPAMNAQSPEFWEQAAQKLTNSAASVGLETDPQFTSERIGFVCYDAEFSCTVGGRDFYQISARSTGGSGSTETVVQSTYSRVGQ
jgi:type IV pilus assembly protein PilX